MTEMKAEEVKQVNRGENPARFQRTDQWRPVYTWLESLDLDEEIKSKDISDWLAANPEINNQLCSRHSRYHLMHYIKKCHKKILKKRNGGQLKPSEPKPLNVVNPIVSKLPPTVPSNALATVPNDSDLYQVKRQEALQKFEILRELEKQLSAVITNKKAAENCVD